MAREELERARAALRDAGVDLAVLAAPANICYLAGVDVPLPIDSGWETSEGQVLIVLSVTDGQGVLLWPDAWLPLLGTPLLQDVRPFPTLNMDHAVNGTEAFLAILEMALEDKGLRRGVVVGIEPRCLSERVAALLRDHDAQPRLIDATAALDKARRRKTSREIALIRRAVAAADAGQDALTALCRGEAVGMSEVDLFTRVYAAVHQEANGPVPIVGELVSGPRTGIVSYPGGPRARVVRRGDTVIQDISVRVAGYWADCTNTLVVADDPTPEQRRYWMAARRALDACVEALQPGATAGSVAAAARRSFAMDGFRVTPYCGHQIGAAVNEPPRLLEYDQTVIEEGMVFAVEPGVYGGAETGLGARAERVVVVRADGPDILSRFSWAID